MKGSMNVISNNNIVASLIAGLIETFDEKFMIFKKKAFLRKMKVYVITGVGSDFIDNVIRNASNSGCDQSFIDVLKRHSINDEPFFVSDYSIDDKGRIDFVHSTVLRVTVLDGNRIPIDHAVANFIDLFSDVGALRSDVNGDEIAYIITEVILGLPYNLRYQQDTSTG